MNVLTAERLAVVSRQGPGYRQASDDQRVHFVVERAIEETPSILPSVVDRRKRRKYL